MSHDSFLLVANREKNIHIHVPFSHFILCPLSKGIYRSILGNFQLAKKTIVEIIMFK